MVHWEIARVTYLRDTSQAVREDVTFLHTSGHKKDAGRPMNEQTSVLIYKRNLFPIDDSQES